MNNDYIVKFTRPWVVLNYTTQLLKFSWTQLLKWISTCDFVLNNDLDFTIEKFDRFQLIKVDDWQDKVLFDWFVDSLTATIDTLSIYWKWLRELLNYKFCVEDKIYSDITVEDMLNDICVNWKLNVTDSITIDWPEFDTIDYTLANFEVNYWESIYSILDRLSKIWFFSFDMTSWEIITLRKLPWIDRTQNNANFLRLTYNKDDIYWNNITNLSSTSSDKYSVILGRNKEVENEKFLQKQTTPTMDSIWLYYMYENGSLQWSTEPIWVVQLWTLLDDLQQEVRILDFDIVDIVWLTLWLWDKVKVEVTNASPYLNYDWDWYITEKRLSFENWLEVVTYVFAWWVIQSKPNILRTLFNMKWWVNTQTDLKAVTHAKSILLN